MAATALFAHVIFLAKINNFDKLKCYNLVSFAMYTLSYETLMNLMAATALFAQVIFLTKINNIEKRNVYILLYLDWLEWFARSR
jgi:hypothetical protein